MGVQLVFQKKNSCRNFFIQSASNHNHMGKAFHPIRNQLSKWISQFAMYSSCCWRLFNLHSLANLRTAEQKTRLIFRKAIACCCLWQNLEWNLDIMQLTTSKTAWLAILNFKSVQYSASAFFWNFHYNLAKLLLQFQSNHLSWLQSLWVLRSEELLQRLTVNKDFKLRDTSNDLHSSLFWMSHSESTKF